MRKGRIFTLMLAVLVGLQTIIWLLENGGAFGQVWANLAQPALWRGAAFSQGPRFADYVLFLNETVPVDLRVVLPPQQAGLKTLGTTPVMQFLLSPRAVINCGSPACVNDLSLEASAVLVVNDFPGQGVASSLPVQVKFNDNWGVLLPEGTSSIQPIDRPAGLLALLASAILPLVWLGALSATGGVIIYRLLPGGSFTANLALGCGLSLSGLTLSLALLSLLGVRLNGAVVWGATLALLLSGAIALSGGPIRRPSRAIPAPDPWLVAILGLSLAAAFLSIGRGYSASDELLLWGPKGYGIAADGGIGGATNWGTNTVDYPLHVPLLIAAFKLLGFETLPASKLVFSAYFGATLLLVYAFLVRNRLPRTASGLATLLLGLASLIFRHATLAYANLPLAFYLFAGVYLLAQAFTAPVDRRLAIGAGLFLASAAWDRPEGLVLALITLLVALGFASRLTAPPRLAAAGVPLALYVLLWGGLWVKVYAQSSSRGDLLAEALAGLSGGELHLAEAVYILRSTLGYLFDPKAVGVLGVGLLAALAVIAWRYRPRQRGASFALTCGLAYALAILGVYYLASYSREHDISWWVSTGLVRMLFPALMTAWAGALGSLQPLWHH